jgi:hypothetical protein
MTRIASLACAFASVLFLSPRTPWSPPNDAVQSPVSAGLEKELKRVETDIDKIFADTLAELPSISSGAGSRMKRMATSRA